VLVRQTFECIFKKMHDWKAMVSIKFAESGRLKNATKNRSVRLSAYDIK